MLKHTQTIRWQQRMNCLSVSDHFVGLALKGLKDIYELAEPCLRKCYFLWSNETRILKNWGRVELSFMVALPKS